MAGVLESRKLEVFALGLAAGKSYTDASREAGYNTTAKSFEVKARQRGNRPDVKARVRELQEDLQERVVEKLVVDLTWIEERLMAFASAVFDRTDIKPADALRAVDMLVKVRGFYAPEKKIVAGDAQQPMVVKRIVSVIVDPNPRPDHRHAGGELQPGNGRLPHRDTESLCAPSQARPV
jgi:hypothetical protein